ncbi:MAG: SpoIIE family protein phosphatase [Halanaerobiaceae bacterium]|nr:SpoIIE family protein phosphatase [Halanaerobiaceae bacterium]
MLLDLHPVMNQEYIIREEKGTSLLGKILIVIPGLFLGQAEIAGLYPLALVYLTMIVFVKPGIFLITLISVAAALIRGGNSLNLIYIISALPGFIIYRRKRDKKAGQDIVLLNTLFYFLLALGKNIYLGSLPVYYFFTLLETSLVFILACPGLEGMKQLLDKKRDLSRQALLALYLISAGSLIGLARMTHFPAESVNIIIYLLAISMSSILGLNYTILPVLFYGIVMINTGIIPVEKIFSYVVLSFSVSLFRKRQKKGVIIAILLGFLLYSGIAPSFFDLQRTAIELLIAGGIFLLVPLKYWHLFYDSFINKNEGEQKQYCPELDKGLRQHLSELARVFNELSATFQETAGLVDLSREFADFTFVFNNKVCGKCKSKRKCWQEDKDDTYKRLFLLFREGEGKGHLEDGSIEKYFAGKCPYIRKMIRTVKDSYEIYQINRFWRDRLIDRQKIVSEQLLGIGEILEQFSAESFMGIAEDGRVEEIRKKARENNLDILSIDIHGNINTNKNYYTVRFEQCSGHCPCQQQFLALLNSYYEYNYRVIEKNCGNKLKDISCEVIYAPLGNYRFSIASFMKASSGEISGDSFLYKGLKDGKELVVLSDGMGVGEKAASESQAAINLLESIIDAGFVPDLAIRTVNSALYLRNREESFTTLDICLFDTFSGKAVFSKIGAVDTYIKRGWELIRIESASLPAGILERIEVSHQELELQAGDFVIMFTDGMLDIRDDIEDKKEWLRQLLQNSSFDKAEELLDYLQGEVLNYDGEISDDLTIVVIKVEEVAKKRRKFNALPRINLGI